MRYDLSINGTELNPRGSDAIESASVSTIVSLGWPIRVYLITVLIIDRSQSQIRTRFVCRTAAKEALGVEKYLPYNVEDWMEIFRKKKRRRETCRVVKTASYNNFVEATARC